MCVSPYIVTKKNGEKVPVPCGHCIECLQDWSDSWAFRLEQECKQVICPVHLTLTFNPENIPVKYNDEVGEWQSYVSKRDVQLFLKRLRKECPEFKNNLRYFAVGEYGSDGNRCHYHILLMSSCIHSVYHYYNKFLKCWDQGFIYVSFGDHKRIHYLTKYLNKLDKSPHITPPFKLMSKSIGLCYLCDKVVEYYLRTFNSGCKNSKGYWQKLPRYYRKKLDEWSYRNPYLNRAGLTYSEVLGLQEYKAKREIDSLFHNFCIGFDEIAPSLISEEIAFCREHGFHFHEPSVMEVFRLFCKKFPEIMRLQAASDNKLRDIEVKHLRTNLTLKDVEKVYSSA